MDTVTLDIIKGIFILRISTLVHLTFRIKDLKGYQSWIADTDLYSIEYYLENCTIVSEYDTKEKWIQVLKLLDNKWLLQ